MYRQQDRKRVVDPLRKGRERRRNWSALSGCVAILLMLILGLSFPGLAIAQQNALVSVSAPVDPVDSGQTFTISIVVEPNNAIAGVQFNLAFDPSLVTVDSVAEGDLLNQNGASTYFNPGTIDNTTGIVTGIAGAITSPGQTVSTAGTFAIITLTAGPSEATCPLTLSNVVIGDIQGQSVPVSVTNGQVDIDVNESPVLDSIGDQSVNEGEILEFTIAATDQGGDALTYSASNLPSGASFDVDIQTFTWTPDYAQAGTYPNIHFEVFDGELTDSEDITITVIDANRAPVLDSIGDQSVNEGETLQFTISATDPDGDALTYTASNLPSGASFDVDAQTFTWTPDYAQAGTYPNIHFEVSDDGMTDSEDITITVNQPYEDWDVNQDGEANVLDMITIGQHWNETNSIGWIPADANEDGMINVLDMILVGQHWTA